jgi:cyanuric acid amidohydrolase
VSSDELTEEAIRSRWDLYSELAHASCGGEKSRVEICLLANSQSASGGLRIGHAIADTLVASGGIKDALRSAGLSFDCCPSTSQLDQVIQAFAHPVIPHSGQLLGKSTTLWEDPQAIKTAKSVVGGIVAGVLGKTSIYVSGGERNSHQGPPGGYPVAAVIKCDS